MVPLSRGSRAVDLLVDVVNQMPFNIERGSGKFRPTGVKALDSERPRALLIEKVRVVPGAVAVDASGRKTTAHYGLGISTDPSGDPALILGRAHLTATRENTANAGAQSQLLRHNFDLLEGTLWVAPYIFTLQGFSGDFGGHDPDGLISVKYRVVEVPWPVHVKLYAQVDGTTHRREDWWQP